MWLSFFHVAIVVAVAVVVAVVVVVIDKGEILTHWNLKLSENNCFKFSHY